MEADAGNCNKAALMCVKRAHPLMVWGGEYEIPKLCTQTPPLWTRPIPPGGPGRHTGPEIHWVEGTKLVCAGMYCVYGSAH